MYTHHVLDDGKTVLKYEEDLIPGDLIAETVLDGLYTRFATVQAITSADIAVIEVSHFTNARDRSLLKAVNDDRFRFLIGTPIFRKWAKYDLYRIAPLFKRVEVNKGAVLFKKGDVTDCLSFLMEGHVDIVPSLDTNGLRNVIVSIQRYEYYGESGILTHFKPEKYKPKQVYREHCYAIAGAFSEILVLRPEHYQILDKDTVLQMVNVFRSKKHWRFDRFADMKAEKKRLQTYSREIAFISSNGDVSNQDGPEEGSSFLPHISGKLSAEAFGVDAAPELEDIPRLLNDNLDPLFVTATCRNTVEFNHARSIIESIRRPASALPPEDHHAIEMHNVGSRVLHQVHSARARTATPSASADEGDVTHRSAPHAINRIAERHPSRHLTSADMARPLTTRNRVPRAMMHQSPQDDELSLSDDSADALDRKGLSLKRSKILRGSTRIPNSKSYCDMLDKSQMFGEADLPIIIQSPGMAKLSRGSGSRL